MVREWWSKKMFFSNYDLQGLEGGSVGLQEAREEELLVIKMGENGTI